MHLFTGGVAHPGAMCNSERDLRAQLYQAVLDYLRRERLAVLPCKPGTKWPLGRWKEYQTVLPSEGTIAERFSRTSNISAICLVTGRVSRRVVVDIDPRNGGSLEKARELGLPETRAVRTGSGGWHLHYSLPDNVEVRTQNLAPGIELKAEGAVVLLPPSLHPDTSRPYEWLDPAAPLAELPDFIWNGASTPGTGAAVAKTKPVSELLAGVPAGERDNAAIRLAGRLVARGLRDEEIILLMRAWNELNQPPMGELLGDPDPETWIREKIASARRMESAKKGEGLDFPAECFVGLAGEWAELMSEHYEAPKVFWFFDFLTILGARLADKVTLASDIKYEPRLYTVKLGRSGVTHKSTVQNRTFRLFEDAGCAPDVCFGVGSAEGLLEALAEHPVLLLMVDELRSILAKASIQNATLGDILSQLYEKAPVANRTRGKRLDIRNAYLSLVGASTVESYQLAWSPTCLANGLNNRLFLVYGEPTTSVPFVGQVDVGREADIKRRLAGLVEEVERRAQQGLTLVVRDQEFALPSGLVLRLTPEAQAAWREWYDTQPRSVHAVRLGTIGMRLAILYALAQGGLEEVDETAIRKVCQVLDWQLRVRQAHDPIDADTSVARLEEAIRRQLAARGPLTRRELFIYTNARRLGIWAFDTALENLLGAGEVAVDGKHYRLVEGG